jgi:hypothetical protein
MAFIFTLVCLSQDIFWTILLSEVSLTGKLIKLAIDILVITSFLMIYYHPRVRASKEARAVIASGDDE